MKIKMMKTMDLIPYENNPRNNDGAIQYVANSIKNFGFKVPIVVDKDKVIVSGHTRWKAAQLLELDEVPVLVAEDLTPDQVKAFRIADNKVAEKASWDYTKLGDEIKDLLNVDLDFDLTDIGFGEFEISALTGDFEPEGFDEEVMEEYKDKEEEMLAKKRVIITYDAEQEDLVKKLLKVDKIKVVFSIDELQNG